MSDSIIAKGSEVIYIGTNYTDMGKQIKFGRAGVAVVLNPYTGKYELSVKPYYKDENNEWVELYSFEDDMKYCHYMGIISECEYEGKTIPEEVEKYVRELISKKNFAREQANAFVESHFGSSKKIETGYAMNKWRDLILEDDDVKKLLEDYLKNKK